MNSYLSVLQYKETQEFDSYHGDSALTDLGSSLELVVEVYSCIL